MNKLQTIHFELKDWLISVLPTQETTWIFLCLPPNHTHADQPLGNEQFYRTSADAIAAARGFVEYQQSWGQMSDLLENWREAGKITAADYYSAIA